MLPFERLERRELSFVQVPSTPRRDAGPLV
jgi:hypothetical protein